MDGGNTETWLALIQLCNAATGVIVASVAWAALGDSIKRWLAALWPTRSADAAE